MKFIRGDNLQNITFAAKNEMQSECLTKSLNDTHISESCALLTRKLKPKSKKLSKTDLV